MAAQLYVGEKVKVKRHGTVVTVEVVEIDGAKFCADIPGEGLEWLATSSIVK